MKVFALLAAFVATAFAKTLDVDFTQAIMQKAMEGVFNETHIEGLKAKLGGAKIALIGAGVDNPAKGIVVFSKSGVISTSISGVDSFGAECVSKGLLFHIHDKWEQTGISAVNDGCGPDFTSGHFDPTIACSGATANTLCATKGGPVPSSSVDPAANGVYTCNPEAFAANPYTCEIGDLNGKFGQPKVRFGKVFYPKFGFEGSPLPYYANLENQQLSVVFHCGGPSGDDASPVRGKRIMCGKIF